MNTLSAKSQICLVIGDPIAHSLSPEMHNAGYEKLGLSGKFIYLASRVKVEDIADFITGVKAMGIRGVSCTMPHKIAVIPYLDDVDPVAKKIGAVNTIVQNGGVLKGYNTDWLGVVKPLEAVTSLHGKKVAVVGAGGAARAAAYGVTKMGATLTIFNRTLENAQNVASDFGADVKSLEELSDIQNADIIINMTSVGLHPHEDETPIPQKYITPKHIVFDAIYTPYETKLLKEAKKQGARVIHGVDMLLEQGVAQFKLYTEREAPVAAMKQVLYKSLTKEST